MDEITEPSIPMQECADDDGTNLTDTDSNLPNISRFSDYRKLIDDISLRLHKENALRLAHLYELPSWYFEIGPSKDQCYCLRVLVALEGKGVYAPDRLKGLTEALKNVEREDLSSSVKDFIRKKSEQGVTRERARRQTHPQASPYVYYRRPGGIAAAGAGDGSNQSNSNNNTTLYRHSFLPTSTLLHSTSLTSIQAEACAGELVSIGATDVYKTRSRPNLYPTTVADVFVETDAAALAPSPSLSCPELSSSVTALQVAHVSATALKEQLKLIAKSFPTAAEPSASLETAAAVSLMKALAAADEVVESLKQTSPMVTAASQGGRFSHSSSYTMEMSRVPSSCSAEGGGANAEDRKPPPPDGNYKNDAGTSFEERRKRPSSKKRPPPSSSSYPISAPHHEKMHPATAPASSSSTSTYVPPSSLPSSPSHHPTTTTSRSGLSRRRSRKEDKKMNKRGILMWHIKVKKLKSCISGNRQDVKLESEDFYDTSKRRIKASLSPCGLGNDAGNHMTLQIHCLDEPRSNSLSNTEIVVSVVDPQSESVTVVRPIRRSLERRGIRVVQQFLAHSLVEECKCSYLTIMLAVVGASSSWQEESDNSDPEE